MTNRSNSPAPWIELSAAGAGLIAVMFFAMWARAAPPVCARFPETPRRVELSWDVDREHLANDLAAADRIARRYAAASPHADGRLRYRKLSCQNTASAACRGGTIAPELSMRTPMVAGDGTADAMVTCGG